MVPSGYKEDTVYSVVPSDGSGDLSFTRASNGTRVNSAGLVEVVAWNLAQYSEDFSNASWDKLNGASVTANTTNAPNGTLTAGTLNVTAVTYSGLGRPISGVSANYNVSIYAKKNTKNWLYLIDVSGAAARAWFDLDNGVLGTVASGYTATITNVGDGWYRCTLSNNTAQALSYYQLGLADANNGITPTSSGSAFIWGAQLNIGSTAKPYFPTTDRLNVPRLTYQNGGGGCPSLLLEKQSTNLVTYSEEFDNAAWGVFQSASISANTTISPDGTQNADTLTFSADPSSLIFQSYISVSNTFTITVYAKSSTGKKFCFRNYDGVGVVRSSDFTTTSSWQRFTFTFTSALANVGICNELAGGSGAIQIWGAQLEASSYPTSYIPTTSSSATRVADACFKTGISSLIGTEFTIFFDGIESTGGDYSRYMILKGSGGTYANFISLEGNPLNKIAAIVNNNASLAVFSVTSNSLTNGQRVKMALRCKNNDFAFYINGALIASQASGSVPTTSDLYLGYYTDYPENDNKINQAVIFNTGLSNADLIALTTI